MSEQPAPIPNDGTPIWDLVIADMRTRDHVGRVRYGVPLQANNGRDALKDAYDECLDMAVYLRQKIEERLITGVEQVEIIPSNMSDAELDVALSALLAEHRLRHGGRK